MPEHPDLDPKQTAKAKLLKLLCGCTCDHNFTSDMRLIVRCLLTTYLCFSFHRVEAKSG